MFYKRDEELFYLLIMTPITDVLSQQMMQNFPLI